MSQSVAGQAEVIIIDGGIVVGCSIAYHLAELGVSEVLVLGAQETDFPYDLAHCGSRYTAELFRDLESITGQPAGYRSAGSLAAVLNAER